MVLLVWSLRQPQGCYACSPHPPGQEEFDACELPSKARRDALAAALQIPARSVQVWFQNRRQRAKATVVGQMYAAGCGGQKRSAGEEAQEEAEAETKAETEGQAVARRGGGAARRGTARGGATSAMDSLVMISSLAAAEHAAGRGSHSAPSA